MGIFAAKSRKDLSADALFKRLRAGFDKVPDNRSKDAAISMGNALMSAFAMFSLKDPSLLAFDRRRLDPNDNFRAIYGIQRVPCDSQMRDILDPVDPTHLRPMFLDVFRCLQRGKALKDFVFLDGHYLISLDGTGYFSSSTIKCASCLEKHHRNGTVTYSHQMLGAVLVHPDRKEVIPLAPEPIIKADGDAKNDCERNATRRWLKLFRQEHPHLPIVVVEDGLAANAPHVRDLREANARFIIGVKPGDHAFLFQRLYAVAATADDADDQTPTLTVIDDDTHVLHHFRFHHDLPLNESNPDCLVNVLEYWEIHPTKIVKNVARVGKVQYFSWITDWPLTPDTVYDVMRGGRARWKIENETFNTLKNQGYNLEHNYGHGDKNLSVVLALLMMLAFLVDQTQQACCPLFRAALAKVGAKYRLWEQIHNLFKFFLFDSMTAILEALARGIELHPPVLCDSS